MPPDPLLLNRQLWAIPTPTTTAVPRTCTPFMLPSGGIVALGNDSVLTLSQDAVFQPACSGQPATQPVNVDQLTTETAVFDVQEPFYASTSPQIYAIAAATIVSYMLVIILFITPRTFLVSGVGGTSGFLGQRSMIAGGSGGSSVIGIGSRPWLQKVAALTVAISLTIATADTFNVARDQYEAGYEDAAALTESVGEGLEIRISRVISDTCLWLAQVQTLIRLFTRHKEKVIIKWIGFALIVFDTAFSIVNYFVVGHGRTRARRFVDAIPALSYLFALALSLLYAAWVIYYSLSKHRYAFFHPKMRNIFLVAILALTAVLIPVVFFVLDISQPNVAGWGDYVRWVGAAAASVVVWEWVERIEALERDEKKDGILGREIFAGDEMLHVTPSTEVNGSGHRRDIRKTGGRGGQGAGAGTSTGWNGMAGIASRLVGSRMPVNNRHHRRQKNRHRSNKGREKPMNGTAKSPACRPPTGPVPVTSPVSREDTTSAASTLYVIHYHENEEPTPPPRLPNLAARDSCVSHGQIELDSSQVQETENLERLNPFRGGWQRVMNSFKHGRSSPPLEVAQARAGVGEAQGATENLSQNLNIASRPAGFFERLRYNNRSSNIDLASLPRTIIPAPRLGIDLLMEAEAEAARNGLLRLGPAISPVASPGNELSDNTKYRAPMPSALQISRRASSVAISPTGVRYSPTDIRDTQLSQRGNLPISEDRSRPNAPQSNESPSPKISIPSQQGENDDSPASSRVHDDSLAAPGLASSVGRKNSPLEDVHEVHSHCKP